MKQESNKTLEVRLFGPLEVLLDDVPIEAKAWGRQKTKALFKILIAERGRIFSTDKLIDLLYDEADPIKVLNNLRGRVSELRKSLEPSLKSGQGSTYILNKSGTYSFNSTVDCRVDIESFEDHLHTAFDLSNTDRSELAIREFEEVVKLYRGDFLEEDLYEEWTIPFRERFQQLYIEALLGKAQCHLKVNQATQAVDCSNQVLKCVTYNEKAYRIKMRAQYAEGAQQLALETYDDCVNMLKDHLSVEPAPKTKQLHFQIRNHEVPEEEKHVPNNLPVPTTEFVGREQEIGQLLQIIEDRQGLLTSVIGLGGIGKTRLAMELASRVLAQFKDGVYWVALSGVDTIDLLPFTIAEALNFNFYGETSPHKQLADFLKEKHMMLVLDNFDHLVKNAQFLEEILNSAKQVTCLVTSQEKLNLQRERLFFLDGMDFSSDTASENLDTNEAVQLFMSGAKRINPGFQPNRQNYEEIAFICQMLEGSPLAIELASAWVDTLSCKEVGEEIRKTLDFLSTSMKDAPERQRSLRASFEYTWHWFGNSERTAFINLSVFFSGFTKTAAEKIGHVSLRQLSSLVAKSVVRRIDDDRYDMHPLLRQYAYEKLQDQDQAKEIQNHHCLHYLETLVNLESNLKGQGQLKAVKEISLEIENIHHAWDYALENDLERLKDCIDVLHLFYEIKSWYPMALERYTKAINVLIKVPNSEKLSLDPLIAKLSLCKGWMEYHLTKFDLAKELIKKSLAYFDTAKMECDRAFALRGLATVIHYGDFDYDSALPIYEKSLALSIKLGDCYEQCMALLNLGTLQADKGQYSLAMETYQTCGSLLRQSKNMFGLGKLFNSIGIAYIGMSRVEDSDTCLEKSKSYLNKALRIVNDFGQRLVATTLSNIAIIEDELGNHEAAMKYGKDALKIYQGLGIEGEVARLNINLGNTQFNLGNFTQSKGFFLKGLELAREQNFLEIIMTSIYYLANIALKENYKEASIELFAFVAIHHPMALYRDDVENTVTQLIKESDAVLEDFEVAKQNVKDHQLDDALSIIDSIF